MFPKIFPKKQSFTGIDINPKGVYLAKFRNLTVRLDSPLLAFLPLPMGVMNNRDLLDPMSVAERIKTLVSEAKCQNDPIVLGLPESWATVQEVQFEEDLTIIECEDVLKSYLADSLSLPKREVTFDFQLQNQRAALVVYTTQQKILNFIKVANIAGLKLEIIDYNPFALARCRTFLSLKETSSFLKRTDQQINPDFWVSIGLALRE